MFKKIDIDKNYRFDKPVEKPVLIVIMIEMIMSLKKYEWNIIVIWEQII